jgi:hypothetical protein
MSNEVGISAYKIYKWLDGKGKPKHEDVVKIGKWLGINVEVVPNAEAQDAGSNGAPLPGSDSGQKVLLDLNIILDLLKSAQGEKSRLLDVIDANLTSLQTTQRIILAHVKAGHKWEAKKYGEGSEEKENSILAQLGKFADEYVPGDEEVYRNVKNDT